MGLLENRRVLLCITGGIAAYKAAELARMLAKDGATVRVAMTAAAQKFVGPLTFQALTGKPVLVDIFDQQQESEISHIEAARWPDAVVVAPATANIIGKLANGIADDIVSTILTATRQPIVLAPAMNWAMYQNEIVQQNLKRLAELERFHIIEPEPGDLACGETGRGRLADLCHITDLTGYAARTAPDLSDETVLVTAGPTYEDIDPVRYVANRSSGKMGFAIAREARARGAKVVLVAGPNSLTVPYDIEVVAVRSAKDMHEAVTEYAKDANVIIKAAAVADYRPARTSSQKIHKTEKEYHLAMTSTEDILKSLGEKKKRTQFLVGFAAETQQVLESGRSKLRAKKLDMIVVNDVSQEGAGFEVETNEVRIIDKKGHIESLPMMPKAEVATILFDMIQKLRASNSNSTSNSDRRTSTARRSSSGRGRRGGRGRAKSATADNKEAPAGKSNATTADKQSAPAAKPSAPADTQSAPAAKQNAPAAKPSAPAADKKPDTQKD